MVHALLSAANDEMEKRGFERDAILVGSVAKGTHLKNPDIDIFLRFPQNLHKDKLKKLGIEIGKGLLPNGFAKYAEHPYWRGKYRGFDVDIVPCYKIKAPEERISAVDRTPFHTEYIKAHLKEEQKDEVRLLKGFLKGIGAYGAEAKIQGFSGYMTELLILKYGDFLSTLKAVSAWRRRVYLHLGNGNRKFKAPLVFIDPVDPERNAASAVSDEKKSLFTHASKSYLHSPKLEFFFPNPIEPLEKREILHRIERRGTIFYIITLPRPDIIDDNLYPQMNRTLEAFMKILSDFNPLTGFYIVQDVVYFVIEVERDTLPRVKIHEGPPVWTSNAKDFIERWKGKALRGPYIKKYRWYADVERKHITLEESFFSNLPHYKLGKSFDKMKERIRIGRIEEFLDEISTTSLTEFFDFKFPWER